MTICATNAQLCPIANYAKQTQHVKHAILVTCFKLIPNASHAQYQAVYPALPHRHAHNVTQPMDMCSKQIPYNNVYQYVEMP